MLIESIETFPVALPFREPYIGANGVLEHREMVILRLCGDDGTAGHGDAVPLALRGGPGLAAVLADIEERCAPVLRDSAIDPDLGPVQAGAAIRSLLGECAAAGAHGPALAAVDAALLDLVGRTRGLPAWSLLGAASATAVICNGSLGGGGADAVAAAAAELTGRGFGTLKVKAGTGGDEERLGAVREAAGEAVALRVDANGAWSVAEAVAMLAALAAFELELAEQPCADAHGLAAVRARCAVPIVADESVATRADADHCVELGACEAATLKLAKVGGPHVALALAADLPCYLSSALDSALGIAAALHTAQALPTSGFAAGRAHGLATSSLFADDVADASSLAGPTIAPPEAPGLGVEVDDAALERLRIEVRP